MNNKQKIASVILMVEANREDDKLSTTNKAEKVDNDVFEGMRPLDWVLLFGTLSVILIALIVGIIVCLIW